MIVQITSGDDRREERVISLIDVEGTDADQFSKDWESAQAIVQERDMPGTDSIIAELREMGWNIASLDIALEVKD